MKSSSDLAIVIRGSEEDIFEGLDIDEETKNSIKNYIKRRLAPQPTKIRADIEVTCFAYEGIDAVKHALVEGENQSTPEVQFKIKLIAPPLYVMTSLTLDKDDGIAKMTAAIEVIKTVILSHG